MVCFKVYVIQTPYQTIIFHKKRGGAGRRITSGYLLRQALAGLPRVPSFGLNQIRPPKKRQAFLRAPELQIPATLYERGAASLPGKFADTIRGTLQERNLRSSQRRKHCCTLTEAGPKR